VILDAYGRPVEVEPIPDESPGEADHRQRCAKLWGDNGKPPSWAKTVRSEGFVKLVWR
jgi:hypothetical protein